ncbi:MAG: hypothetical protein J6I68_11470 [Butyrivibrio sp.]|uniref:hypothetical protein n=1 Tax=Butyrivibrio sp. TaxID=28121 RepID=UPI001B597224|nr:hypothetical protein [Butyrivibrio sp.]MBP3783855.1 hypothetical protein [Butyrivibrio sp.]
MAIPKITFDEYRFGGKSYYTRVVTTPKHGMQTVSSQSFEDALIVNDEYVNERAKVIDYDIFCYVEDNAFFSMSDKDLAALVDKEVA